MEQQMQPLSSRTGAEFEPPDEQMVEAYLAKFIDEHRSIGKGRAAQDMAQDLSSCRCRGTR